MKFIDKMYEPGPFIFTFSLVDIYMREEGDTGGKVWPVFNIDVLTIDGGAGVSITIPFMKVSLGINFNKLVRAVK